MRQIRASVFETNSSSMHSLVIKKNSDYYTNEEIHEHLWLHNGEWDIWREESIEFGRHPFKCLGTFESKVRYAIASLCGYHRDREERFKEIENIVKEVVIECTNIKLPKMSWSDNEGLSYGYVDEDILTPFLKEENISLKEFLTNKKYVVIVDGDEYCIWDSMKEAGLINMDEIEKECY